MIFFLCMGLLFLILIKGVVLMMQFGVELQTQSIREQIVYTMLMLSNDFLLLCVVFFCLFFVKVAEAKRIKQIIYVIVVALMLLFCMDLIALVFFQSRLYMVDMLVMVQTPSMEVYSPMYIVLFVSILCVVLYISYRLAKIMRKKLSAFMSSPLFFMYVLIGGLTVGIVLQSLYFFVQGDKRFAGLQYLQRNVLEIAIDQLSPSQSDYIKTLDETAEYADYFTQVAGSNQQKNVIILFLESISQVDSQLLGGLENRIANHDRAISSGQGWTNFMSNGCTSDVAHIAVLQGVEARNYGHVFGQKIYDKYQGYLQPLPQFFGSYGYDTSFVSTASLDFLDQGEFIKKMGFDRIVTGANMTGETYVFGALPDAKLYDLMLDDIDISKASNPDRSLLVVGQTISMHKPFSTPYGTTEIEAYRYVDESFGKFYDDLVARRFFDDGVLVLVSDHRKMMPIESDEFAKRGRSAYGRIVGGIIGSGVSSGTMYDGIVQHIDIYHTLKRMIATGTLDVLALYNDPILSVNNRDWAVRYCNFKEKEYIVSLQTGTIVDDATKKNVAQYIKAYAGFQQDYMNQLLYPTSSTGIVVGGSGEIIDIYTTDDLEDIQVQDDIFDVVPHGLTGVTLIGHGGSPAYAPYNSLAGAVEAYRQGADALEIDVSFTKDRVNVVAHGPDIWSPTCRGQNFSDILFDTLQQNCLLANGELILPLEQFLAGVKMFYTTIYVELKVRNPEDGIRMAKQAVDAVNASQTNDSVIFISYDGTTRDRLAKQKDIKIARDTFTADDIDLLDKNDIYESFMMPFDRYTPVHLQRLYELDKPAITYTPKTTGDLLNSYDLGLRSFMVDDIPWAIGVLRERIEGSR